MKRKTFAGIALICMVLALALSACQNPLNSISGPGGSGGGDSAKATLKLALGPGQSASRAVAAYDGSTDPTAAEFARMIYVIDLTHESGHKESHTTEKGATYAEFAVFSGRWNIRVLVYLDSIGEGNLFAVGHQQVTALPNKSNPVTVPMETPPSTGGPPSAPIPAAPVISGQPQGAAYHFGATPAAITVTAAAQSGGSLYYQWYGNSSASGSGGTAIIGETGSSFTPGSTTMATVGTYYYYVVVSDPANGLSSTSNVAVIVVNTQVNAANPTISVHPAGATYATNATATALSVSASSSDGGSISYQWYSNTVNTNAGGALIGGQTSSAYTPPTTTAGTVYYYVEITNTISDNGDGGQKTATVASNPATVVVNPPVNADTPSISTQPAAANYTTGATATALSVAASVTDGGALSYQWYSNASNSNSGGTLIGGQTNASYTPPTGTVGTVYYYVVVTNTIPNNGDGGTKTATLASNTAAITVNVVNAATPVITVHPAGASYTIGASPSSLVIGASTSDDVNLLYKWYSNTINSNSGGTDTTITNNLFVPDTTTAGTFYYYVVVTSNIPDNGDGGVKTATVTSDVAVIVVNAMVNAANPAISGQPTGASYYSNAGTVTPLSVTASSTDSGTLSYKWYAKTTGGNTGGTFINGATGNTYTPLLTGTIPGTSINAVGTVYYYAQVTNTITDNLDGGNKTATVASDSVAVTVTQAAWGVALKNGAAALSTHAFAGAIAGYSAAPIALSVTVQNTGNQATGALTAALSGTNANSFKINSGTAGASGSVSSVAVSGTGSFTVQPVTGLTAGTHNATVTVSGGNGINASFIVSFIVTPTYTWNTPANVTANGVTASVSFNPASPKASGTSVQATVSFSGTATNAGTFSVNLTSSTAGLSGSAQTFTAAAGASGFGTKIFNFTVPAANVNDMALSLSVSHSLTVNRVSAQSASYGSVAITTGNATANAAGSGVTVTATPGSGYAFVKWVSTNSVSATAVSTSAAYTFNISANTTLYAVFGKTSLASMVDLTELNTIGAAANTTYTLTANITFTGPSTIFLNAANVTLNGGGYTVTRGSGFSEVFFQVSTAGASLTLTNITLNGGSASSVTAGAPLVQVERGSLTLGSGTTLRNNKNTTNTEAGGAKACLGGTLIMQTGATITGNETTSGLGGGGVMIVDYSQFTMNGGSIQNNTGGSSGGGVHVYSGTFTMNAAASSISGNSPVQVKKYSGTINGSGSGVNTAGW